MSRPRVGVVLRGNRWYSRYPAINHCTGKRSIYWAIPEEILDLSSKTRSKEQAEEVVAALKIRVRDSKVAYIPWYENGKLFFEHPTIISEVHSSTVADFLECYWEGRGSAKKSKLVIRNQLNAVKKGIGSLIHKDVKDSDIMNWIERMKESGLSNTTIRIYFRILQTACNYCYERKKLGEETNLDIERFSLDGIIPKSNPRRQWFTEETFEKFYNWYNSKDPHMALFFLGCYLTGSRLQEVAAYQWSWVRESPAFGAPNAPKGAIFRYFEVPVDPNKTEMLYNEVVIVDRLWDALVKAYPRKEDRTTGLIFTQLDGQALTSNYWNGWNRLLRMAFPGHWWEGGADGIVVRDCRRSRNTNNMLGGMDKETAKLFTKHKSDTCFQMYDGRDKRLQMMKGLHPEWFASKQTVNVQSEENVPKTAENAK